MGNYSISKQFLALKEDIANQNRNGPVKVIPPPANYKPPRVYKRKARPSSAKNSFRHHHWKLF